MEGWKPEGVCWVRHGVEGRLEAGLGKYNENVLMGDHLGVREKPGDRKP